MGTCLGLALGGLGGRWGWNLWVVRWVLVVFAIYEDGSVLEVCWRVDLMLDHTAT